MFQVVRPSTAFTLDKSSKDTKRIEDPAHLAFIRRLPSVISGKTPCEAAHIRTGSALYRKKHTGIGQKSDDAWTLPLTEDEHRNGPESQHGNNELSWWKSHGIDPFDLASRLYEASGDFEAAVSIIQQARKAK